MTNTATAEQARAIYKEAKEKGISPEQLFKERGFEQVSIEISEETHNALVSKKEKDETVSDTLARILKEKTAA